MTPTMVKGGIRGDGSPPTGPPNLRDPKLFVVGESRKQFAHWCTARGWSPLDRGIQFLRLEERTFLGWRFVPGDLVIELESVDVHSSRWTSDAKAYHRIKLWHGGEVGFRKERTVP